jgi:hypothetical protein
MEEKMKKRVRSTGHLGYSKGFEYIFCPEGSGIGASIWRSDMADPVRKSYTNPKVWLRYSERFYCMADEFRKMIDNPMVLNLYNEKGGRYFERTIFKRMEEIK